MESNDVEREGETDKGVDFKLCPEEEPSAPLQQPTKDHCDLLLDAIDAHLTRLEEQGAGVRKDRDYKGADDTSTAHLTHCVSMDPGFCGTILTSDVITTPLSMVNVKAQASGRDTGNKICVTEEEETEGVESKKEQCMWRLEKLLGSNSAGFEGKVPLSTDSIRTEDFAAMFEEAMVFPLIQTRADELGCKGYSENKQQMYGDLEERSHCPPVDGKELKHTCKQNKCLDMFYQCDFQSLGKTHPNEKDFSMMPQSQHQAPNNTKAHLSAESRSLHVAGLRKQSQQSTVARQSWEHSGAPAVHGLSSDKDETPASRRPGVTCKAQTERCSHSSASHIFKNIASLGSPSKTASGAGFPSNSTDVQTASQSCVKSTGDPEETSHKLKVRSLAGVPVCSFDTVTIDSDLESVHTDQVREYLQSVLSSSAAVRSAMCFQAGDVSSDQSDLDTHTGGRRIWFGPSGRSRAEMLSRTRSVRKTHQPKKASRRTKFLLSDDDEESSKVHTKRGGPYRWRSAPDVQSRDLGQQDTNSPRRQTKQGGGDYLAVAADLWPEGTGMDRLRLEELLSSLKKDCVREEERLDEKRAQLQETEHSLTVLQQQKKHALHELESVQAAVQRAQRESLSLEASLKKSRLQADAARSQLRSPQRQVDACLQEVRGQEVELHRTRQTDGERSPGLTTLEREELDRLLDRAKTELFAEQRRARLKVDSLQERLEEIQQELDLRMDSERTLRERCSYLEEQLRHTVKQQEVQEQVSGGSAQALETQLHQLQVELKEQAGRAGALEHLLAQKEFQLLGVCEGQTALRAEMQVQKEQYAARLREAQEQVQREKDQQLKLLRVELTSAGELQVQQVLREADQDKLKALKEQASVHSQHTDTLQNCVQLKEEEITKLTETLKQQREELQAEAQRMVHRAIEEEKKKWESEKEEIQRQHTILEEQGQQEVERTKKEVERERQNVLALQNQVLELQNHVQELEAEGWRLRRQQASALSELRRTLMEEQQAELQQLRRHAEQEERREVSRLQKALEQADGEVRALRGTLAERIRSQEEEAARVEQQHRGWALALGTECQHLQDLLECKGTEGSTVQLQDSLSVCQGIQTLRALREQLHALVSHLQQELDTQRHTRQRLAREKDYELQRVREQLEKEKEQALNLLRERLVKEHMEEMSGVQRDRLRDSGGEAGGLVVSLRRQLRNKDAELREVQKNMGCWKEQTASRMARKFEEELTAELERRTMRTKELKEMKRMEDDMMQLTMEHSGSVSSPCLLSTEPCSNPMAPDLASLRLLRHLQVRIRQLRAESWAHTCSPSHLTTAGDLAGSYLEMIMPPVERTQARSRGRTRTVHS